jgi:hypothetical protein
MLPELKSVSPEIESKCELYIFCSEIGFALSSRMVIPLVDIFMEYALGSANIMPADLQAIGCEYKRHRFIFNEMLGVLVSRNQSWLASRVQRL